MPGSVACSWARPLDRTELSSVGLRVGPKNEGGDGEKWRAGRRGRRGSWPLGSCADVRTCADVSGAGSTVVLRTVTHAASRGITIILFFYVCF